MDVVIETGSRGNLTFTATWKRDTSDFGVTGVKKVYDGQLEGVTPKGTLAKGEKWQYSLDGKKWQDDTYLFKDVTVTEENPEGKTVYVRIVDASEQELWRGSAAVKISHRTVTITPQDAMKAYGDEDPELKADVSGVLSGEEDKVTYTLSRKNGEAAGDYPITVKAEKIQGNYKVQTNEGTFTIYQGSRKEELSVTSYEGVYDGEYHDIEVKGIVDGDTVEYSYDNGQTWVSELKSYKDVTSQGIAVRVTNKNYAPEETILTGSVVITPFEMVVTADNKSKVYGEADPDFTATVAPKNEGTEKPDDSYEIVYDELIRQAGEDVGEYTIYVSGDGVQGNYHVTYNNGTLEITQAQRPEDHQLSVTSYNDVYDGNAHTIAVNNLLSGDKVEYSYDGGENWTEELKTYTDVTEATIKVRVTNDNYTPAQTELEGTVTITQKEVTVTADSESKVYGSADPELTATVSGTLNGDTVDYAVNREEGEDVGTYAITASGEESQGNYKVSYVPGTFTITPADRETAVKVGSYSGEYDAKAHTLKVTGTVEGDQVEYSYDNGKTWIDELEEYTNVTGEPVQIRVKVTNENYKPIEELAGSVYIYPKAVTVKAKDASKAYGEADPELTAAVEGTLTNDTVTYEVSRASGEDVGTYPIKVSGEALQGNYSVTYEGAEFEIYQADREKAVSVKSYEGTYDGQAHTIAVENLEPGDSVEYSYDGGKTWEKTLKDYTDVTDGEEILVRVTNGNYKPVEDIQGTVKINPAIVTVTTPSLSKTFDGTALTAKGEISGLINDETVSFETTGSQTFVGDSKNTYSLEWDGSAKETNYTVEKNIGTLTVTDGSSEEPVDPDKVVTKTHDGKTYGLGDTITFTIQVTNIYDTEKTITIEEQDGVTITGQSVFDNVAPGETVKTTAEYVVTQDDLRSGSFTNKVTAQFEGGKDYTNIDTVEDLDDLNSHIVITKKATSTPENGESYALGETISYEITVKNDGNVTVNNIVIEDELTGNTGDQAWTIPSLEPGEFKTFYPSYTVTEEDILLGEVVNEAVMSSAEKADEKDPAPDTTPGADTQKTDEKNSHITINKVVTSTPANGSGYALDETITYKITVVNDGNLTVEDITVIDELTEDEWYIDSLAPGSSEEYEAEYKVTENDILAGNVANEATASGTSIDPGQPEVPVDPGEVDVPTDEKEGHITISKEVISTPDNKNAYALGETITYKITATNDGNLTVKDVIVTDELTGETWDKVTLAPGESKEYTTEYTVTEQDILNGTVLNVAAATGESPDPEQPEVPVKPGEEEVPTVTPQPSLFVEKEAQPKADGSDYGLGDTITYIITVTNNGNVTINDITVEDALTGNVGENALHIDTLAPNTTETLTVQYVVTEEDILAGSIANSVTVSGTDPDGEDVPADDEVIVDVEEANPELTLTKTTTSTPENGESYALNETITYEIIAANTGNLTLTNVVVNDELTGDTWTIGTLEPGESQSFEASYVVTETDIHNGNIVNVATAEADNPTNDPENPSEEPDKPTTVVPGETDDKTDEEAPSLAVTKNVVNAADEYQIGDVVEYEITVTNNGNVTQNGIVVEDNIQAAGDVVITNISGVQGTINGSTVILEALAPGQTAVISCEYTVLKEDRGTTIINTAKVTGDEEEPDVTPDVPVDVEDVYDIYVVHEFAAGEAENASLPNDYTIENLAPGTVRELNAEAVEGYTAYPAAQTAVVEDQDVTVVFTYYTDEMGTDPENPEKPDGIPDTYQANVTYAVNNGTLSFNNAVVTLYDSNGNPSESGTGYLMGTQIPDAAPNEGYGSLNWTPQVPDTKTPITGDMTFTANFVINSYTVTFLVNGMIVDTQTVIHGQSAADPGYTAPDGYRFSGWSRSLENITGNTVITGTTILIPVPPVPTPEPTPTPDPAPVPDPAPTPDPAPETTPQQNPGTTAPVNPADDDTDDADNDDDTDDADVIDIDDEETPLGDAPGKNESETEYDLTVLEDEETPLSDGQDNGDSNHKCCILHFLLLCAALIIELLYTHSQKKRQKHIFELREMLAEKNGGRIE